MNLYDMKQYNHATNEKQHISLGTDRAGAIDWLFDLSERYGELENELIISTASLRATYKNKKGQTIFIMAEPRT